jgi:hypothetical protein
MPGLKPDLYNQCRTVLLQTDQFGSYRRLRAVFESVDLLSPFRFRLKEADNPAELVELNLPLLIDSKLRDRRPVLPILLQVLRDLHDRQDERWVTLNDLHDKIHEILAPPENLPPPSPRRRQLLLDRLLQLDFRPQIRMAKQVVGDHRVAAFVIHGPPWHGQRMLAYRLARLEPQWETGQHIIVDASSNGTGKSSDRLWGQVAKKLQLPPTTSPEELAAKVGEWWDTQDVIFTFYAVDYIPADLLCAWIEEFWDPLVVMAQHTESRTRRRTHLLLFLVDNAGELCHSNLALCKDPQNLHVAPVPLLLPPVEPFPEVELEIWIDSAAEVVPTGLSAHTLITAPYGGIPELVYEEICSHCGFSWEGEIAI